MEEHATPVEPGAPKPITITDGETPNVETQTNMSMPEDKPVEAAASDAPAEETSPPVPQKSRKKLLIIGGVILALIAAAAVAVLLLGNKSDTKQAVTVKTPVVTKKAVTSKAVTASYLASPSVIPDPNVFSDASVLFNKDPGNCTTEAACTAQSKASASDINYYKLGTNASGQAVILAVGPVYPLNDQDKILLIQDSANHYIAYLKQFANTDGTLSSGTSLAAASKGVSANVTANTTDVLPDYEFASQTSVKGLKISGYFNGTDGTYSQPYIRFIKGLDDLHTGRSASDRSLLGKIGVQDFYEVTATDSGYFKVQEVYGTVGGSLAANYSYDDQIINSNTVKKITWTSGEETTNSHDFTARPAGCGSANGFIVAKNVPEGNLVIVGKAADGTTLYQLPATDPLFLKIYTEDYGTGEYTEGTKYKNLTKDQFQADHGMFVAKNALGEYVVYQNEDIIRAGGGCAKPVVYLYPTTPTNVNVRVGAKVTKSVPTYPAATGWQNVLAQPSGALTYQGKAYDSLFWEGLGLGSYPQVSAGTVVAHDKVVSTIKTQLAEQGLNAKETADFLAYWQPKLPTTPFVRLTWFDTAQLDELAPLTITPKPQTVIRTFLDFQGLNLPVVMTPQTFHAPARTGFTAVEWGGLLRK